MSVFHKAIILTVLIVMALSFPAFAENMGHFEFGTRGNIVTVDGKPTHDMSGFGILGRYRLKKHWLLGLSLDYYSGFDVEGPAGIVGIQQDPSVKTIDVKGNAYTIMFWIEKRFGEKPQNGLSWFSTAGLGMGFVDVDGVKGATKDGGHFDIETDPGTEFILSVCVGPRYTFLKNWAVELGAKVDYHFADWKLKDRISGCTGSVDDYTAWGSYLGINYKF